MRTIFFLIATVCAYIWLNENGYMEVILANLKGFDPSILLENVGNMLKDLLANINK